MDYRRLGRTDLKVSAICLGTMTWGQQNTEAEGHEQMDYALDQGVNFFDTAELYSIPPKPETQGATETIIGSYPFVDEKGAPNTNIVIRSRDPEKLAAAKVAVVAMLAEVKAKMA